MTENSESLTKSPEDQWRTIVDAVDFWMEREGIDLAIPRFSEYVAKIAKREFHSPSSSRPQGILIVGGTGCGKTRRVDFMARRLNVTLVEARELVDRVATYRSTSEDFKDAIRVIPHNCINNSRDNDLIIDDIGTEDREQVVYGNRRDTMADIIMDRYRAYTDVRMGCLTHFTTNLTAEMLRERYGERVFSRLREMCVFVVMPGGDRRMAWRMANG